MSKANVLPLGYIPSLRDLGFGYLALGSGVHTLSLGSTLPLVAYKD